MNNEKCLGEEQLHGHENKTMDRVGKIQPSKISAGNSILLLLNV